MYLFGVATSYFILPPPPPENISSFAALVQIVEVANFPTWLSCYGSVTMGRESSVHSACSMHAFRAAMKVAVAYVIMRYVQSGKGVQRATGILCMETSKE